MGAIRDHRQRDLSGGGVACERGVLHRASGPPRALRAGDAARAFWAGRGGHRSGVRGVGEWRSVIPHGGHAHARRRALHPAMNDGRSVRWPGEARSCARGGAADRSRRRRPGCHGGCAQLAPPLGGDPAGARSNRAAFGPDSDRSRRAESACDSAGADDAGSDRTPSVRHDGHDDEGPRHPRAERVRGAVAAPRRPAQAARPPRSRDQAGGVRDPRPLPLAAPRSLRHAVGSGAEDARRTADPGADGREAVTASPAHSPLPARPDRQR